MNLFHKASTKNSIRFFKNTFKKWDSFVIWTVENYKASLIEIQKSRTKNFRFFNDNLKHCVAPEQKQVKGNHAPPRTKDFSKEITNMSKTKNKYLHWSSWENFISYKRIENVCNSISKKSKRSFFKEVVKHGIITSRKYKIAVDLITN